jgi:hypothetical protein
VLFVSPSYHPDASSAELVHQQDGWLLWFVLGQPRVFDFFPREWVRDDIGKRALRNERRDVQYVESRLKAVGYQGVSRRPSLVQGADIAAAWDFAPPI